MQCFASASLRSWSAASWCWVAVCLCGCSGGVFENRQAVQGTVTLDGRPLSKALISFLPIGNTEGPKVSGVVQDGRFSIPAAKGPLPGEFQVKVEAISPEIEAMASGDFQSLRETAGTETIVIAPEFNRESRLTATVRDGQPNRFQFQVKSGTPR